MDCIKSAREWQYFYTAKNSYEKYPFYFIQSNLSEYLIVSLYLPASVVKFSLTGEGSNPKDLDSICVPTCANEATGVAVSKGYTVDAP